MQTGVIELPKWVTTEGVFCALGFAWFGLHAAFPTVPDFMPLGLPVPGFENLTITPGLLVGLSVIPIVIKLVGANRSTPFVARDAARAEGEKNDA